MTASARDIARALVRCPSVTPAEGGALSYLEKLLGDAGFKTHRVTFSEAGTPDVENLYAKIGTGAPHLTFAGHTDVVPTGDETLWRFPPFSAEIADGRMWGRGAVDMKGGIAAFAAAALRHVARHGAPDGTISLLITGDEEGPSINGTVKLLDWADKRGEKFSHAIVGEPTRLQVVTAHKGSLWLQLTARGQAAHGATPHLGQNAIHEMARIVDFLETDYAAQLRRRKHPLLGHGTVNTGKISGGSQPNIVPDVCVIEIDRRTLPGETEKSVIREIATLLRAKKLSSEIASAKLAPALPLETDFKLPLVQNFLRSAKQKQPVGVHYFCDAAVLAAGGIPSVVFGPGDIAQAHTADEWITVEALERGKRLLRRFLQALS